MASSSTVQFPSKRTKRRRISSALWRFRLDQSFVLLVSLLLISVVIVQAEFNYEVEKRVLERIDDYLSGPIIANGLTFKFRANGGFPNDMDARDRDAYLRFEYSLLQEIHMDMLYYGLEDGTFVGHGIGWGTYREPFNSGYNVNDPGMQKYLQACVNRQTGQAENCTMSPGSSYIRCIRNCALMKCPDEETQACANVIPGITTSSKDNNHNCQANHTTKWCRQYEVLQTPAMIQEQDQNNSTTAATTSRDGSSATSSPALLGFVPRTYYCHDVKGAFTQDAGKAVTQGFLQTATSDDLVLGDCTYEDGVTKVQRTDIGDYAYCGGDGQVCENTFHGGYRSRDYDPRYRDWYIQTRETQLPNWSPPYPFFSNLDLGITYSHPIYSTDERTGRRIFEGVLAVDYTFADISHFLVESYKDSSTVVVVFEAQEPDNFLVASSTGRKAASKVLASDNTEPCPDDSTDNGECVVVRERMKALKGNTMDSLLVRSFQAQKEANYPRELLSVKTSDLDSDDLGEYNEHGVYIVQSTSYNPGGALEWIILVISPAGKGSTDSLTKEDSLFGVVCVVAGLGFVLCLAMFISFYRQRNERAIILADWRFTSAFLLGCALLNLSSFTLLGENTDTLCLARMWTFHLLFVVALSPLFVKVWRMWRMVGAPNRRPAIVNHTTASLLSMPIIAIQAFILVIVTFVDRPHQEEIIDVQDGIVTQRVVCEQDSIGFGIVEIIFEAGLVLVGCVLAYITRNLDPQFGEAKQLMFSMYNIAFIGIITTVIVYTMNIDTTGQIVLTSIGIFWGTVFSSAAFVLPRLMRVQSEKKLGSALRSKQSGNGDHSGVNRESKVRFSCHEEQKSSIASDRQRRSNSTNGTDKKSNKAKDNGKKKKKREEEAPSGTSPKAGGFDTGGRSDKPSLSGTGWSTNDTPSAADLSSGSFNKGTGWSVYEKIDPNASIGCWDDKSDEMKSAEKKSAPGTSSTAISPGSHSPTKQQDGPATPSDQFRMPSEEFNMCTIRETEDADASDSQNEEKTEHRDPLV